MAMVTLTVFTGCSLANFTQHFLKMVVEIEASTLPHV